MALIKCLMEKWGALAIAGVSLLVAIVSLIKSSKAQKLQNRVNELELKIKQNELDRIKEENEAKNASCVEARVIEIASGKHRLKVWNSGNTTAYNVSAKFNEGTQIIILDSEIMPFEVLEPNKNFDVNLIFHFGSAQKFEITTMWSDMSGEKREKKQLCSI